MLSSAHRIFIGVRFHRRPHPSRGAHNRPGKPTTLREWLRPSPGKQVTNGHPRNEGRLLGPDSALLGRFAPRSRSSGQGEEKCGLTHRQAVARQWYDNDRMRAWRRCGLRAPLPKRYGPCDSPESLANKRYCWGSNRRRSRPQRRSIFHSLPATWPKSKRVPSPSRSTSADFRNQPRRRKRQFCRRFNRLHRPTKLACPAWHEARARHPHGSPIQGRKQAKEILSALWSSTRVSSAHETIAEILPPAFPL